jgi:hypothetical protein
MLLLGLHTARWCSPPVPRNLQSRVGVATSAGIRQGRVVAAAHKCDAERLVRAAARPGQHGDGIRPVRAELHPTGARPTAAASGPETARQTIAGRQRRCSSRSTLHASARANQRRGPLERHRRFPAGSGARRRAARSPTARTPARPRRRPDRRSAQARRAGPPLGAQQRTQPPAHIPPRPPRPPQREAKRRRARFRPAPRPLTVATRTPGRASHASAAIVRLPNRCSGATKVTANA